MFWQSASIQGVLRYFGVEFTARGVMKVVLALAAVFIFVAWLLQPAHKEPEARALVGNAS